MEVSGQEDIFGGPLGPQVCLVPAVTLLETDLGKVNRL